MRAWGRILFVLAAILGVVLLGSRGEDPQPVSGAASAPSAGASTRDAAPAGPATVAPAPATATPGTPAAAASSQPTSARGRSGSAAATASATASATTSATPAPGGGQQAAALLTVLSVADGDTLTVRVDGRAERVRVIGIDTPEVGECGADEARDALERSVSGGVRLEPDATQADRDRYGRLLRHVVLPDGSLAAQRLIAAGHGREYTYDRRYRHRDAYVAAQRSARGKGSGIWGAACPQALAAPAPKPERTRNPQPAPPPAAPQRAQGGCDIKGNINSEGERIYHVPGGRSYDKTKITTSKGEKWFCSESEAVAAGWRAARG